MCFVEECAGEVTHMILLILIHFYYVYCILYRPHAERILPKLPQPHKRLISPAIMYFLTYLSTCETRYMFNSIKHKICLTLQIVVATRFNIQEFYCLSLHIAYFCGFGSAIRLPVQPWLVFITEVECVYCAVRRCEPRVCVCV